MADFNYVPNVCDESTQFEVDKMAFGDGYTQRSPKGINNGLRMWSVEFADVSQATADAMVNFFRGKLGSISFTFRPIGYAVDVHVVCVSYSKPLANRYIGNTMVYNVRASFEETPL